MRRDQIAITVTYTAALTVFYWLGIACRVITAHFNG